QETDKIEQKRRTKFKQNNIYDDEKTSDLILQGQLKKNTGTFGFSWQIRYTKLYPNRLELHYEKGDKDPEVYTMERIEHIDSKEVKGQKTITIHLKGGNEPRLMLSPQVIVSFHECRIALNNALNKSTLTFSSSKQIRSIITIVVVCHLIEIISFIYPSMVN
ncbi:unnamed protein product, partial [Adineta steineri]